MNGRGTTITGAFGVKRPSGILACIFFICFRGSRMTHLAPGSFESDCGRAGGDGLGWQ